MPPGAARHAPRRSVLDHPDIVDQAVAAGDRRRAGVGAACRIRGRAARPSFRLDRLTPPKVSARIVASLSQQTRSASGRTRPVRVARLQRRGSISPLIPRMVVRIRMAMSSVARGSWRRQAWRRANHRSQALGERLRTTNLGAGPPESINYIDRALFRVTRTARSACRTASRLTGPKVPSPRGNRLLHLILRCSAFPSNYAESHVALSRAGIRANLSAERRLCTFAQHLIIHDANMRSQEL